MFPLSLAPIRAGAIYFCKENAASWLKAELIPIMFLMTAFDPERNFAAAWSRWLAYGYNQAFSGTQCSFECGSLWILFRGLASSASIEHQ